jgi:NAD(P)-dependent dehydrogenase (short-subunit alcohol dehydrogenase family)
MGDLKVVDGKPVAPRLATLEVNLIGVFYSQQQHSLSSILQYSLSDDRHSAVHLGMHYVKRNRAPDSWKAIVMIGSVGTYELRAFITPVTLTNRSGAASWNGIPMAPQYTASKHGVLGLMRALDPIVAVDNIRIAVIHPWFAGALADLCATISILILDFSEKTRRSSGSP